MTPGDDVADEPALAWRQPPRINRWCDAVATRRRGTRSWARWGAVLLAAIISGPFAVGAALVNNSLAGVGMLILVVAVAPLIEELVKGAGALYLAEERPWLVPAHWTLPVVTLVSGLCFAAIENWWYLVVLIDDPTRELIRWRWIFGPVLHGTASFIVGLGAARLWRVSITSEVNPGIEPAQRYVIAAAVLHGTYNLIATILSLTEVIDSGQ